MVKVEPSRLEVGDTVTAGTGIVNVLDPLKPVLSVATREAVATPRVAAFIGIIIDATKLPPLSI